MKKTLRSYGFVPPMVTALVFAFALTASADTGSSGDEGNFIVNGDFTNSKIPVHDGKSGKGREGVSTDSWTIGAEAGLTASDSAWLTKVCSEPYAVLMQRELTTSFISQEFSVPNNGRYLLSFSYKGRDLNGGGIGYQMAVAIDGNKIMTVTTTTTTDWQHGTAVIELEAGVHSLKFYGAREYTDSSQQSDITIILDDVMLEVASDIRSAVWTGNGDPNNAFGDAANWQCYDENGNLLAGKVPDSQTSEMTLAADADWSKVPVSRLTMASLNLAGHNLKIAGNGTLTKKITVSSGENYVKNGDFTVAENLNRDNGTWGWAGEATNPVTAEPWKLGRNTGITAKDSAWTTKVFSEPYSAYIQKEYVGYSSLSQTVTVPAAGRYRLSFCYVGRDKYVNTVGHKLAVSFDDQHLTSVTTTTYSAWSYCAAEVELTQGEHELKLYGESQYEASVIPTDCSSIVDDIELRPVRECCLTVEVPEGVEFNNSKLNLKALRA